MKLKNKKTGEIGYLQNDTVVKRLRVVNDINDTVGEYNSLAELNTDWEDAPEEPKKYWYIAHNGIVGCFEYDDDWQYMDFNWQDRLKQIGNYFESEEEAKQAVERLRAWKRLKDYNVKFNLDFIRNRIDFTYSINNPLLDVLDGEEQIFNSMKIVFGGK